MQTLQQTPLQAAERTRESSLCGMHVVSRQGAIGRGHNGSAASGPRARARQGYEPSHGLQAPRIVEAKNEQSESGVLGSQSRQSDRTHEAGCGRLSVEWRRLAPQYLYSSDARVRQMVKGGSCSRRSVYQMRIDRTTGSAPHAGIRARPARLRNQKPRRRAPSCGDFI